MTLKVGVDMSGDSVPYIPDWFSDYRVVDAAGSRRVAGLTGDDPAGHFEVREPGTHVIAYRSTRDFVDLGAEKFNRYLADEGLDAILRMRRDSGRTGTSGREYYSRCAKSMIRVGGESTAGLHAKVLGYTLELVPENDPFALTAGDALTLQLLYRGAPLEGVRVAAFTAEQPDAKLEARTDTLGRVEFVLPHAGFWLVKAVHMIAIPPPRRKADWESFWASLTFEVP